MTKMRVGEVRPSQAIHTFGVGALVDLPNFSAVALGLDDWEPPTPRTEITEKRVLGIVKSHLGPQVERLVGPPVAESDSFRDAFDPERLKGVPLAPFPRWVRCPNCDLIAPLDSGVFRLKEDHWRPDRTRYVHESCPRSRGAAPATVPVRFIQVCEHGHMDDFPWIEFVHSGPTKCDARLRIREFGVSAEAADIVVQCDTCETSRPMALAFSEEGQKLLSTCRGCHPHLRISNSKCKMKPKASLAGASNLWFPVTATAMSIPTDQGELSLLVAEHWGVLQKAQDAQNVGLLRQVMEQLQAFAKWSDDEIWEAIVEARQGSEGKVEARGIQELKREEWDIFSHPSAAPKRPDFRLREVAAPDGYEPWIERVVLVERLRVVQALIGFTRIISPGDYADIDEIEEARRVPLARRPPEWVPASEVRGEGLFIQIRESALRAWCDEVSERNGSFRTAHTRFRQARRIEDPEANYPGIRYVLLHSLSHSLIRQLAIECGYTAASLQERIYAADDDEPMAGVLLYTAAPDSEGTLGGLVSLGEPHHLARHLDQALEDVRLCASDPLCAEHEPGDDGLSLHGAACHACLFAAETSCERGNKYLDRSLLIETMTGAVNPFFHDGFDD